MVFFRSLRTISIVFIHIRTLQVVYNANHLSKLVEKKEKCLNKIEYLQKQQATRQNSKRTTTRKGFLGLVGEKVDALDFYTIKCNRLAEEIKKERCHILSSEKCVMKAGFVSFNSRWGAAVCAQTQQSKDSTCWLTDWAPEARDVCWDNLSIPYMELNSRRLLIGFIIFFIASFFMIPITFVQSLANLDALDKNFHFLKPLLDQRFIRSVLQGFLPGLSLKLSLTFLPQLMMFLSKFEGRVSLSKIERNAATKYFVVMVVNVFFGNVIVGSVFEQLKQYVDSPIRVPKAFGSSIPMKSTFFITYIMVDGWSTVAAEALRLWAFLWYHLQNMVIVKTEKDRNKAMAFTTPQYNALLPKLGLYFLLGLVYAVISPLILPFIIVFFAFGYIIYRNQVINVYEPKYESSAAFWPLIHRHVVVALLITHITLIGLFSIKRSAASTPLLLPLPIFTLVFHWYCTERFGPAFNQYPLQEARAKDNLERALEPNLDVRSFLETAYLHPAITSALAEDTVTSDKGGIHNLLERRNSEPSTVRSTPRPNADRQLEQSCNISIDLYSASRTNLDH